MKFAKYTPEVRDAIHTIISSLWDESDQRMTADNFIDSATVLLRTLGFRSPNGDTLVARTVRYQVRQCGIRFRNATKV